MGWGGHFYFDAERVESLWQVKLLTSVFNERVF